MIADIMDDFYIALETGRVLSGDYFIYNRETRTFKTDYRFSTKLMIFIRIAALTFIVLFSMLPSFYRDELDLVTVFQTIEIVAINILSGCLYFVNYICHKYNVKTYTALMEIEEALIELNLQFNPKHFKKIIRRLVYLIAVIFCATVQPAYLFCVWINSAADLLLMLTITTALVLFYKITSFIPVFLILWKYYATVNKRLEKLCLEDGKLNKKNTIKSLQKIHRKLTDTCDVWNNAVGVPQIIICGVVFVQATDLILRVFKAFRGGLDYSSLVRLSVSTANVAFTGFMCTAFTYCAELTRNAYARTGRILHRIYLHSKDREFIVDEINSFSLQILLKPLAFTANAMFEFNWSLILIAGHGTITLTVIGMQFIINSSADDE